jgi:hypothetical protein
MACQHRFSLSKGLRSGCAPHFATARPRFRLDTSLPIIHVTASDIGRLLAASFSPRSRKLSLEQVRLALPTATQRPLAATDSMHISLGYSARRSGPSAPYSDLIDTLRRLCARREIWTNIDSSDEPVDSTVYRIHGIVAYRSFGGQRAGDKQEMVDMFMTAWTGV